MATANVKLKSGEQLGFISLFNWHCHRPMRRLLEFVPDGKGGVRRLGMGMPFYTGHVCTTCGHRQMQDYGDIL
jgi:hypothetical protein